MFTVPRKVLKRNSIHPITMKKYISYYEDKREPYRPTTSLRNGKHCPGLSHIVSVEVDSGIPGVGDNEYSGDSSEDSSEDGDSEIMLASQDSWTEQVKNAGSSDMMNHTWTSQACLGGGRGLVQS